MGVFRKTRTVEQLANAASLYWNSNPPRDLATQKLQIEEDFRGYPDAYVQPTRDTADALHYLRDRQQISVVIYVRKNSPLDSAQVDFLVETGKGVVFIQDTSNINLANRHKRHLFSLFGKPAEELPITVVHSKSQKNEPRSIADYASELYQKISSSQPILVYQRTQE